MPSTSRRQLTVDAVPLHSTARDVNVFHLYGVPLAAKCWHGSESCEAEGGYAATAALAAVASPYWAAPGRGNGGLLLLLVEELGNNFVGECGFHDETVRRTQAFLERTRIGVVDHEHEGRR